MQTASRPGSVLYALKSGGFNMIKTLKTVGFWAGEILGAALVFALPIALLFIGHAFGLS
jgi:hypothetical protein